MIGTEQRLIDIHGMDRLVLLITDRLLQSGCPSESLYTGHKYLHILCSFQNSIHMPLFHTNFSPILQPCSFRVLDPCSQTVNLLTMNYCRAILLDDSQCKTQSKLSPKNSQVDCLKFCPPEEFLLHNYLSKITPDYIEILQQFTSGWCQHIM